MTNTHSKGPAAATLHFHIASSQARRSGLNAKVPDMVAEGAEREGGEKKGEAEKLSEGGKKGDGERERRGRWWDGESRLTKYVFELSGECPSFRERGWVHGL